MIRHEYDNVVFLFALLVTVVTSVIYQANPESYGYYDIFVCTVVTIIIRGKPFDFGIRKEGYALLISDSWVDFF